MPSVLAQFSLEAPTEADGPSGSPVRFSPVSTYVHGGKDVGSSSGYVVSSIGKHWGVIVGELPEALLYHLVFENPHDIPTNAGPDSLTGKVRVVIFDMMLCKSSMMKSTSTYQVGKTLYSTPELIRIGRISWYGSTN